MNRRAESGMTCSAAAPAGVGVMTRARLATHGATHEATHAATHEAAHGAATATATATATAAAVLVALCCGPAQAVR